jgi:hypothetical protein
MTKITKIAKISFKELKIFKKLTFTIFVVAIGRWFVDVPLQNKKPLLKKWLKNKIRITNPCS